VAFSVRAFTSSSTFPLRSEKNGPAARCGGNQPLPMLPSMGEAVDQNGCCPMIANPSYMFSAIVVGTAIGVYFFVAVSRS
jgi:hypothetical protein